jgi:hypothetical protein
MSEPPHFGILPGGRHDHRFVSVGFQVGMAGMTSGRERLKLIEHAAPSHRRAIPVEGRYRFVLPTVDPTLQVGATCPELDGRADLHRRPGVEAHRRRAGGQEGGQPVAQGEEVRRFPGEENGIGAFEITKEAKVEHCAPPTIVALILTVQPRIGERPSATMTESSTTGRTARW